MENEYVYTTSGDGEIFGLLFATGFILFMLAFAAVFYVINAIFLMKLLKNAGHKNPVAAWVPLWNTVTLFEVAGIKGPWIWVAIFFASGLVSGIPVLGSIIAIGVLVISIILTIWMAKGVHAGLGFESVGGIVLAIFLPFIWLIWVALKSDSVPYNLNAAISNGNTLPIDWFKGGNPYQSFNLVPNFPNNFTNPDVNNNDGI